MLFASSVYWWTDSTEELTEQMLRIIPSLNFSRTFPKVLNKLQTCIRYSQCHGNCSMQRVDILRCFSNSKLQLAGAPFPVSFSTGYFRRREWRSWNFVYLFVKKNFHGQNFLEKSCRVICASKLRPRQDFAWQVSVFDIFRATSPG